MRNFWEYFALAHTSRTYTGSRSNAKVSSYGQWVNTSKTIAAQQQQEQLRNAKSTRERAARRQCRSEGEDRNKTKIYIIKSVQRSDFIWKKIVPTAKKRIVPTTRRTCIQGASNLSITRKTRMTHKIYLMGIFQLNVKRNAPIRVMMTLHFEGSATTNRWTLSTFFQMEAFWGK